MAVKPIPDGYHSVTPYLILDDATRALDFYKKALSATERDSSRSMPSSSPQRTSAETLSRAE